MGLFELPYENIADDGILAKGEIKFAGDEQYLQSYFSKIQVSVSLKDLVGEAVFYLIFPGTVCFYLFIICLIFLNLKTCLLIALSTYIALDFIHRLIYIKPINYIIFVIGHPISKIIMIIIASIMFYIAGNPMRILYACLWYFLAGFLENMIIIPFEMLYSKLLFSLPKNDQILRNVGLYYGKSR